MSQYQLTGLQQTENETQSRQDSERDPAVISRAEKLILEVRQSRKPLRNAWQDALSPQERVSPAALAEALFRLHNKNENESVIEAIEAAIRNNRAQPWMYDVLVQELKIAERPQSEIDRALLSRVDFSTDNEAQLLLTAALLSRFDAHDQAMALCREGVERNPWQPATWGLARRLAAKSDNPEHIIWSYAGSLRHVWNDEHELLHEQLESKLHSLSESLLQDGHSELASSAREQLLEARARDLRIQIQWSGDADVDLAVVEPGGAVCSYKSPLTENGGMLVKQGSGGKKSREEYVCVAAKSGDYRIRVSYITGRVIRGVALLTVTRYENTSAEQKQTRRIEIGERNAEIPLSLKSGRGGQPGAEDR